MTDYTRDTPSLGRMWCPGCLPELDPRTEILDTRWCAGHAAPEAGPDDDKAKTDRIVVGSAEADGHDCREFQKFIKGAA